MKLTNEQVIQLKRAMELLEAADSRIQNALGEASEDLHDRIEDILAEVEQIIELAVNS